MRLTEILDADRRFPVLVVWSPKQNGWLKVFELMNSNVATASLESLLHERDGFNMDDVKIALERYESSGRFDLALFQSDCPPYAPLFFAPSKILCLGLNYKEHVEEFNGAYPKEPVIFCKAPSALIASGSNIVLPPGSHRVDYEAELVAVIGKRGKNISESEALEHVVGYVCGNDVTARDWQLGKPSGQWFLGKSFDTFAPVGPWLVTADEAGDPNNLKIESRLNGVVMQSSSTSQFIFRLERFVAYVSQVMTLEVGDLLFTGTPGGIGASRTPPVFLQDGDVLEVEIEKLGVLRNMARRLPESIA